MHSSLISTNFTIFLNAGFHVRFHDMQRSEERCYNRAGSSMRLVRLKPQGPGSERGPGPPGIKKIYKVGPLCAQFLERKFAVL